MRLPSVRYRIFNVVNLIFLSLLSLTMILPFVNVLAQSLSSSEAIMNGEVSFWPVAFTWINYEYVFGDFSFWRAFAVSVGVTLVGTFVNLVATASLAYPISRTEYKGRGFIVMFVLITVVFSAPLIPNFILMRELHLVNNPLVLIVPGAINAFNFFVMRSFFAQLPTELIDAARIDGCGELGIIGRIILPLSKPVMASLGIFYAVSHWNSYSTALYYLNDSAWWPIQVMLKKLFESDEISVDSGSSMYSSLAHTSPEGIKMATIIIATLPIIIIYPFLQRHFVKGIMVGSVKS
ncbi:protein LplC [Paenibacillus albidus]|uniref:Protein LplC n=1 Tax=Paenibacillus albidus TaxID=2041023 RepID=A0A917D4V9_9BACL|nr:carbohydrate ABC transporter permease [Paenibacillus albidus]MBT2292794.1 carbohydrate ABC transporter permease [Paenibacillus albidus]GGG11995.1 protein LplC [Paenibacillus albidus]